MYLMLLGGVGSGRNVIAVLTNESRSLSVFASLNFVIRNSARVTQKIFRKAHFIMYCVYGANKQPVVSLPFSVITDMWTALMI